MKLKAQHVFDATLVVSQIIRENRPMPQRGKYRLARLHAKLLPEFTTLNERRDAMIAAYDHREVMPGPVEGELVPAPNLSVPLDKMPEFTAAWNEIGNEEIDVAVEPIPLDQLDLGVSADGSILASEMVTLGDLVAE